MATAQLGLYKRHDRHSWESNTDFRNGELALLEHC